MFESSVCVPKVGGREGDQEEAESFAVFAVPVLCSPVVSGLFVFPFIPLSHGPCPRLGVQSRGGTAAPTAG